MKLSEFKVNLKTLDKIKFELPNQQMVPAHFHITEVGKITKNFIDCGGTVREETHINLQLWNSFDVDHRLEADKLLKIIEQSESILNLTDAEIEVEYQSDTISKYGLTLQGDRFILTSKQTDCLAKDNCGIPEPKKKLSLSSITNQKCDPNSNCC